MVFSAHKGFTLLEAVIAIAIFSMGATALFSLVNANLITLARVDAVSDRAAAIESAVDFMGTVDPVAMPQGRVQVGELTVVWQMADTAYQRPVLDEQNTATDNRASLMNADVSVYRQQQMIAEFQLTLLAVQRVTGADALFK